MISARTSNLQDPGLPGQGPISVAAYAEHAPREADLPVRISLLLSLGLGSWGLIAVAFTMVRLAT